MPALERSTLVVAIDGPSGSGKSTVARGVARALGLRYLDTGAMYRALTWWILENGAHPSDEPAVLELAATFDLSVSTNPLHQAVGVAGQDVTRAIRSADVTRAVSTVSAFADVRAALVARQRQIVGHGGIAVEGRDIGTTVCPDAPVKVFLTASADARASRRARDVEAATSGGAGIAGVRADIDRRDRLDSGRAVSPLNQAADAVVIDSTTLDADHVIAAVLTLVRERTGIAGTLAGSALDSIGGDVR